MVLKQGDRRIEGEVIEEREEGIVLRTPTSEIFLKRDLIREIIRGDAPGEDENAADQLASQNQLAEALQRYQKALLTGQGRERIEEKIRQIEIRLLSEEEQQHKDRLDASRRALDSGQPRQAIPILEEIRAATQEGPFREQVSAQLARARFQHAQDLQDRVRLQEALVELRKAIEADPNFKLGILTLADLLRHDPRHVAEAKELYERGFALENGGIDDERECQSRHNWAVLLFQEKNYAEAIEQFNHVLASCSTRDFPLVLDYVVKSHIAIGQERRAGDVEGTVQALRRAIELNPAATQAHFLLAQIYFDSERYSEAIEALRGLLAVDNTYRNANYMIARAHRAQGDMEAAQTALRSEMAVNPRNYEAACELGDLLLEGTKYVEALSEFDRAARINDAPGRAHLGRADALRKLDRFDEALEVCELLRTRDALNPETIRILGLIYFDQKRFAEAQEAFLQALEILGDRSERARLDTSLQAELHRQVGEVAMATTQYNKAEESFQRAIALDPDSTDAYIGLGRAQAHLGRVEDAEDSYVTALEKAPGEPNYYLSLAFLYHRQMERPAEAVPFYLRYLELGGADTENVGRYIQQCGGDPAQTSDLNVATLRSKIRQRRMAASLAVSVLANDRPTSPGASALEDIESDLPAEAVAP